jgi:DNA-binding CsgD family transcriptional regulator
MDRTNVELSKLSHLIGLIYEGATDPSRWTKDILPAVAEYIQAPGCFLFTALHTPQDGGYFFLHGIRQEVVDLYMSKYISSDVWTISAVKKNLFLEGNVVLGEELVTKEQLLESTIYKECLSLNDMAQLMTSVVFGMDSTSSMPSACSFFRGLDQPVFNEEDRKRMQLVLPHLSRSLGVMQRLRTAELTVAASLAVLDRLQSGVLLLNATGAVAFANNKAQRILDDADGLRLRKLTNAAGLGNLIAESVESTKVITDAISATLNRDPYSTLHFSKSVLVPRTSGLASYMLQLSALGDQNEFSAGTGAYAAIIFITDGAQDIEIDSELLQSAYGLTPAEVKVAITLLKSDSVLDVAKILGTSPNTVNTQIKHVYAKLGVDTRARFVKLMLGMATHKT